MFFFLRFYVFIFREGKEERKRGKHQCVFVSHATPTWDLTCNPGMCPDWESNQRPFGTQAGTQSTEPHQPGLNLCLNTLLEDKMPNNCYDVVFN